MNGTTFPLSALLIATFTSLVHAGIFFPSGGGDSSSGSSKFDPAPVVTTEGGQVRGRLVVASNQTHVYLYQGIKFGRAVRFRKPEKAHPWSGVFNATTYRYACPQPKIQPANHTFTDEPSPWPSTRFSNEDCLFLNVYRPAVNSTQPAGRSVMVWIHGGTFLSGTSFETGFDSKHLAALGDVIVVTLNYRLGAFGFLTGDDAGHPGNLGLYDQILALEWVRGNIAAFGGNPADVTLFGESAGSMSVGGLILSPLTKGLFHRAIMQSGAPNSFIGSENRTVAWAKVRLLAGFLGCDPGHTQDPQKSTTPISSLIVCIEGKSTQEIQNVVNTMARLGQFFEPTYGTELLPWPPVQTLKSGHFHADLDLLFGVNRDEGNGVYGLFPDFRPDSRKKITVDTVLDAIHEMVEVFDVEVMGKEVGDFYSKGLNESNQEQMRQVVANVYGDFNLICPALFFGEQLAAVSRAATHRRHFYSYRLMQPLSGGTGGCEPWMGVCHAMDLPFVFGRPIEGENSGRYTTGDIQLSRELIQAWTSFAKTGSPGKVGGTVWEEAFLGAKNLGNLKQLWLDAETGHRVIPGWFSRVCDGFWRAKIF